MSDAPLKQIPEGLCRKHILQAIARFDTDGMPAGFKPSHTYEVRHEGNAYPPPAIMALAVEVLTGTILPAGFRAGKGSLCFQIFENCGFTIYRKRD